MEPLNNQAKQAEAQQPKSENAPIQKTAQRKKRIWEIHKVIPSRSFAIISVISFIAALGLWSLVSYMEWINPTFMPKPHQVLLEFFRLLSMEDYWHNIGISVFRVTAGFLLACMIGIPLGIFAGTFKIAEAMIEPMMEFVRYMPAVAFIPLVMIWAGIGEWAKILVIFIGCFFQLVLMVADNTRQVSDDLLQASYTLGAGRWQSIETVLIPFMLPQLMNTLRLILGWAWTYLVVAELVAGQQRTWLCHYEGPTIFEYRSDFRGNYGHRAFGTDK